MRDIGKLILEGRFFALRTLPIVLKREQMENCITPMVVKRTLFARPVASFLFGASFSTYFPAKTRLQRYVEEASSLPSSTVEEKTVTEDKL